MPLNEKEPEVTGHRKGTRKAGFQTRGYNNFLIFRSFFNPYWVLIHPAHYNRHSPRWVKNGVSKVWRSGRRSCTVRLQNSNPTRLCLYLALTKILSIFLYTPNVLGWAIFWIWEAIIRLELQRCIEIKPPFGIKIGPFFEFQNFARKFGSRIKKK